mgnify:CR=1 FL=1
MTRHTVKPIIEIGDDLFECVQRLARKEKTAFRALAEKGIRLVLKEKQAKPPPSPPLMTMRGSGLAHKDKNAGWDKVQNGIYRGRGA